MQDHITKLTEHQRSYRIALEEANTYTNPDLSAEGLTKQRADLAAKAAAQHTAKLEDLVSDFNRHAGDAKAAAQGQIPKPPADTSKEWARAKMLLDAGRPLHSLVANADPTLLHALTEWGPTYLEAEAYKGRADGWAEVNVDAGPLLRAIQDRWGQVLGGSAAAAIEKGKQAAVAEAQFNAMAQHFGAKLSGTDTGVPDLVAAIEAKLAGQRAATELGTTTNESGAA